MFIFPAPVDCIVWKYLIADKKIAGGGKESPGDPDLSVAVYPKFINENRLRKRKKNMPN